MHKNTSRCIQSDARVLAKRNGVFACDIRATAGRPELRQFDEETQSGSVLILEEAVANQLGCRSNGSTLGVCAKLPELHDLLGSLGHASAAHGLDLLQDSRLRTYPAASLCFRWTMDITDRGVTSSRL